MHLHLSFFMLHDRKPQLSCCLAWGKCAHNGRVHLGEGTFGRGTLGIGTVGLGTVVMFTGEMCTVEWIHDDLLDQC